MRLRLMGLAGSGADAFRQLAKHGRDSLKPFSVSKDRTYLPNSLDQNDRPIGHCLGPRQSSKVSCRGHESIPLCALAPGARLVDGCTSKGKGTLMRARWGLSVLIGLVSFLFAGTGQALSQVLVRVCNDASFAAYVALTAHPSPGDPRFLISGWYNVNSGSCFDTRYVGPGWFYLYAENDSGDIVWSGNDQRFCVNYPGPFDRYISDNYNCSGSFLKGFTGYYSDGGLFTWRLH
jgi:uncharacterized membrane protein